MRTINKIGLLRGTDCKSAPAGGGILYLSDSVMLLLPVHFMLSNRNGIVNTKFIKYVNKKHLVLYPDETPEISVRKRRLLLKKWIPKEKKAENLIIEMNTYSGKMNA